MTVTVKLSTPIEVAGETISELTMREPTAREMRAIGDPFTPVYGADGSTRALNFDNEAVVQYLSKLCTVPPSTVDKLTAKDFLAARSELSRFFFE